MLSKALSVVLPAECPGRRAARDDVQRRVLGVGDLPRDTDRQPAGVRGAYRPSTSSTTGPVTTTRPGRLTLRSGAHGSARGRCPDRAK